MMSRSSTYNPSEEDRRRSAAVTRSFGQSDGPDAAITLSEQYRRERLEEEWKEMMKRATKASRRNEHAEPA